MEGTFISSHSKAYEIINENSALFHDIRGPSSFEITGFVHKLEILWSNTGEIFHE